MTIYSPQNLPPGFYRYAYLRKDGSPYYYGKGKGNRAWSKNHSINLPKDKSRIIILKSNLTEAEAFAEEKLWISFYGRINNGTGILRNLTDGGEGSSGHIHTPETIAKISGENNHFYGQKHNQESRAKMSKAQTGQKKSPETRAKMSAAHTGVKLSPETRAKIGAAKTGKTPSPETRAKMSKAQTGVNNYMYGKTTPYELTDPEGNTYIVRNEFSKFCKDMNLNRSAMRSVALGKAKHHKGWTARII